MKNILLSIVVIMATFFAGCNDDIFVDRVDDVGESEITLSGTGGSASVTFQRRGLEDIDFESDLVPWAETSYYNSDDEYIYKVTDFNEVSRVRYSSPLFEMSCLIEGDKLKIEALDNGYDHDITVAMYLSYGHEAKKVDVRVRPGLPVEVVNVGYDIARPVSGRKTVTSNGVRYNNNSDKVQRFVIYPYQMVPSKVTLMPDSDCEWTRSRHTVTNVPVYVDGEWNYDYPNEVRAIVGGSTEYYPSVADREQKEYVEVQPHSSVRARLTVDFVTLDAAYLGMSVLPNSGVAYNISGDCTVEQPVGYKLEVVCED